MILLRGFLLLVLVPIWAAVGLAIVVAASAAEGPAFEDQARTLGLTTADLNALATAGTVAIVAGLIWHGMSMMATSRSASAMAGSLGALFGAGTAGVISLMATAAPASERSETLARLFSPIGIAMVAVAAVLLGFRAFLAHVGAWRYSKNNQQWNHHYDDVAWGDGD